MARGITVSGTSATCNPGAALGMHIASVPNYLNIMKVKIQPSGGSGPYDFEIFSSDSFGVGALLAKWKNVTSNIYDPADISGGGPAEGNASDFVVAYEDADATGEIHLKFSNNDSVGRTYAYEIVYEEVYPPQIVSSGTYNPSFYSSLNVGGTPTIYGTWQYTRIGNIVHFSGALTIDPVLASNTLTEVSFSLPFASEMTVATDVIGMGVCQAGIVQGPAVLYAETASNIVSMYFLSASTSASIWSVMASYRIL